MKRMRNCARLFCLILSMALLISGCGGSALTKNETNPSDSVQVQNTADAEQEGAAAQEEARAVILTNRGIELPVSDTKIFVNQSGYNASREKKVMFFGDIHGETFNVVRKSDQKIVYTGRITKGKTDALSGQVLSVCDFSEVTAPGSYYIETDIIGQSYPFTIAEDTYEKLFLGLLTNVLDARLEESAKGVCDVSFGMHILMYSLQNNGTLYEEAYTQLSEEGTDNDMVAKLLYMARWLLAKQGEDGSLYEDYEATAAFCGIMMMSRDVFGKYEKTVSKEFLDSAENSWEWLKKQECDTGGRKNARFYAAAQFFKSTGGSEYQQIVDEFLGNSLESYTDDRFVFYGVLSYLNAEKNTNRDMCTHIMQCLVNDTEQICINAKNDEFFCIGNRTIEENLKSILLLSFINYITPNKEYTVIIENTIQYMGGLNETGACYINSSGAWQDTDATAGRNLEWNGIILFCFSDMLKNLSDMEE